jgi:hypothetical protein
MLAMQFVVAGWKSSSVVLMGGPMMTGGDHGPKTQPCCSTFSQPPGSSGRTSRPLSAPHATTAASVNINDIDS